MRNSRTICGIKKTGALIGSFSLSFLKNLTLYPHGCCRFTPTCSQYAREAIRTLPIPLAIVKTILRIMRCNPFFKGGYDPVLPLKKGF